MAKRDWRRLSLRLSWQGLATALAIAAMAGAMSAPAGAQFFDNRYDYGYPSQRPTRPPPSRGFFSFPFFNPGGDSTPFYRPAPAPAPVESYKAPPPRKYETPPAGTVVVIGDTMADWLAYGLEETLATDSPELGVERKIRPTSGLVRYDPRDDALDWAAAIKDALATEKPSAIVVMLGLNDRLPLRDRAPPPHAAAPQTAPQGADKTPAAAAQDTEQPPLAASEPHAPPGGPYDFHTDKWAELYSKRIDDMIGALKSKGVPVLWVGLPAIWGPRGVTDISYLDELYRERAERAGIVYVDIWDGFVDENGRFTTQGPDFEGQTRRLRTTDGVHFTKAGAMKLAQYVEQDLRRITSNHLLPVSLPAPEANAPKPGAGPRPDVGPVLPLTADTTPNDGTDLAGGGSRAQPVNADPEAVRVLGRGDPIPAPRGRADDFSWPRPGADTGGTADAEPAPAVSPPVKGAAASTAKKPQDTRIKPAPAPAPSAARPAPRAQLDGAPRPPAPAGGF